MHLVPGPGYLLGIHTLQDEETEHRTDKELDPAAECQNSN